MYMYMCVHVQVYAQIGNYLPLCEDAGEMEGRWGKK
jgi:hypothetical protein